MGDSLSKPRFGPKTDLSYVLAKECFTNHYHDSADAAAKGLISLVAIIAVDHSMSFSPRARPCMDKYVTVTNPTTNKTSEVSIEDYTSRFRTSWAWFHLAKSVARFVRYRMTEKFRKPFNHPSYTIISLHSNSHDTSSSCYLRPSSARTRRFMWTSQPEKNVQIVWTKRSPGS